MSDLIEIEAKALIRKEDYEKLPLFSKTAGPTSRSTTTSIARVTP